ncbi:MAG: sulfotransferase domain-containing protein, partial [Okeania sp. SIO2H7]|nr:sulfotransferase domain-containing protein [Okeania sp. SIO2H7]
IYYKSACYQQTLKNNPEFVKKYWEIGQLRSPEFAVIGVNKGGTTSLYGYLIQHPQVIAPIKKEMDFWSWKFNDSINWYKSHFPPIPEGVNFVTGEASPSYFDYREAPSRLFNAFPKVKLILLLRNPVDRAVSQYHHCIRLNWDNRQMEEVFNSDLEKLIAGKIDLWRKELNYLARGVYVEFVREWLRVFPREQLLVLKSEEFYQNTAASMEKVLAFLGLPVHRLREYETFNPGKYPPISESMRRRLSDFFQPYNRRLEEYLEMKFNWDN